MIGDNQRVKNLTRAKAIREYCKNQCCAGDQVSWRNCSCTWCPLWRFRKGREINAKGKPLTPSSAKKLREKRGFSAQNTQEKEGLE